VFFFEKKNQKTFTTLGPWRMNIEATAAALVGARATGTKLTTSLGVASAQDAYAIQDRTAALAGEDVAGWKVSLPPGKDPQFAPIFASDTRPSLARWTAPTLGVEAEICFRALRDIAPGSRDDLLPAFEALAGIEIVDSRFAFTPDPLDVLADRINNGGYVIGDGIPNWRDLSLERLVVRVSVDSEILVERTGGHPIDDPFAGVVWLVNHFQGLRAGQFITTGSHTGITPAAHGQRAEICFPELGTAIVDFS